MPLRAAFDRTLRSLDALPASSRTSAVRYSAQGKRARARRGGGGEVLSQPARGARLSGGSAQKPLRQVAHENQTPELGPHATRGHLPRIAAV
eukprot:213022-Chlamydomonas_euryale.AAC.8